MTQRARMSWEAALSGFRVAPDLSGRALALGVHNGYKVRIELPRDVDDSLVDATHSWRPDAPAQVTGADLTGVVTVITVKRLLVRADFTTDLDYLATVPATYSPTPKEFGEVERLHYTATAVVDRILRTFIDMVATKERNYDLVIDEAPSPTFNRLEVGKPWNWVRFGYSSSTALRMGTAGLDRATARRIRSRVRLGQTAALGWVQYLEARRRLIVSGDPRGALVEAVTAIEVASKDALRRKGRNSKAVALLIDTDRLRELLKEVCAAVIGESYSSANSKGYQRLDDLIKQRNSLVHRGETPDLGKLQEQVEAVRDLLEWLDSKVPPKQ